MGSRVDAVGAAHLVLAQGVAQLDPATAVFDGMLAGWSAQQQSRMLNEVTIGSRERLVRRFTQFTNEYPWAWQAQDVEAFTTVAAVRGPVAFDDPRVSRPARLVRRVRVRPALRVGGGVRAAIRAGAGGDLPRVEHGGPRERVRGPTGPAAVDDRRAAAVL